MPNIDNYNVKDKNYRNIHKPDQKTSKFYKSTSLNSNEQAKTSSSDHHPINILEIYSIDGNTFGGDKLVIKPDGPVNGMRKKKDGRVLIGKSTRNQKNEYINDFFLECESSMKDTLLEILYDKGNYIIVTFKRLIAIN